MRYTSTVTIGHAPAATIDHTLDVTTLRGFATILHGSDITTLRGFAAGMVLTFVFSLCYNFVYNVMITERILDYCVDRISPSYPTHPQPRRG